MDTIRIDRKNTLMIAHRGLSGIERENTCAAFIAAANRDYFGIETDVRRTFDGHMVLLHDGSTKRVSPELVKTSENTLDEIRSVSLFDADGKPAPHLRVPVPEEYLSICERYGKKCVLELKSHFTPEELDYIVGLTKEYTSFENMIFISFNYDTLELLREAQPDAEIQFLCDCDVNEELIAKLKARRMDIDIHYTALTEEGVSMLHASGIKVNCWTVDDKQEAEKLVSWGVDFITSNILQ
ncbi:MAG: hypothetical protein J6128_05595 [Clostridia bacterium]|nr:hypothetical protein [Clostridia bacterium]